MRILKAYTLIELLISVALVSSIFALSLPVFNNFLFRNELAAAVNVTVRALRSAQGESQAVDGDSVWGVAIQSGSVLLFKGNTYATRDTNFDVVYTFNTNVSISGLSEITYSKFIGIPNTTGTLNLVDNANTRTITINAKGNLSY